MQKIILLSLILIFTGCEMHEQQSSGQVKRDQKVVNLSVIEELTSAIIRNDLDQLSQILKNGNFDVNVPNKSGELLLNKAINSKRFVITFRLLESGADPDLRDDTGVNARELAQLSEQEKDWELLFSEYKITSETGVNEVFKIIEQTNRANEKEVLTLLEGLFLLETPLDGRNPGQFTYLMVAASRGLVQTVELLCSHEETDPNIVVTRGRGRRQRSFTALSLASTDEVRAALFACGVQVPL